MWQQEQSLDSMHCSNLVGFCLVAMLLPSLEKMSGHELTYVWLFETGAKNLRDSWYNPSHVWKDETKLQAIPLYHYAEHDIFTI